MELGAKDNVSPMLPISSPFTRRIQLKTISKNFMMPTLAAYDEARNPQDDMLNYNTFKELQMKL